MVCSLTQCLDISFLCQSLIDHCFFISSLISLTTGTQKYHQFIVSPAFVGFGSHSIYSILNKAPRCNNNFKH